MVLTRRFKGGKNSTRQYKRKKKFSTYRRKVKNPHKKKKGSKHVKSKNKRKTRKNMHGGGEAYYKVYYKPDARRGAPLPAEAIAGGHAYSRLLPRGFGWVEPHEWHEPDEILNKKIKNDLSNKWILKPETLLSIVLKHAATIEGDTLDKSKYTKTEKWTRVLVGDNRVRQYIQNYPYIITRENNRSWEKHKVPLSDNDLSPISPARSYLDVYENNQ